MLGTVYARRFRNGFTLHLKYPGDAVVRVAAKADNTPVVFASEDMIKAVGPAILKGTYTPEAYITEAQLGV